MSTSRGHARSAAKHMLWSVQLQYSPAISQMKEKKKKNYSSFTGFLLTMSRLTVHMEKFVCACATKISPP